MFLINHTNRYHSSTSFNIISRQFFCSSLLGPGRLHVLHTTFLDGLVSFLIPRGIYTIMGFQSALTFLFSDFFDFFFVSLALSLHSFSGFCLILIHRCGSASQLSLAGARVPRFSGGISPFDSNMAWPTPYSLFSRFQPCTTPDRKI